jgi:hypothetical protein
MEKLFAHLKGLIDRKDRFTYDLRGNCHVYSGVVAAYQSGGEGDHFTDLAQAIGHALRHDGIVGAWRDGRGQVFYDSCRVFTDTEQAVRFARHEGQRAVFNPNREQEVTVPSASVAA